MMLDGIKAVLFDLDGTLVDSMWIWREIDIEYLGRYGYEPTAEMERAIEGMSFTETAVYFKEHYGIPESVEEIKEEWVRLAAGKYAHEIRLKPGAAAFLQRIRKQGMKIGIASSNNRELITACLRLNQVEQYIDCITTSCDVERGKPAPDVYLSVASSLGAAPGECLVFEDVPMGILAGKNAGMRVCAVRDDFSLDQTEKIQMLADYYITTYDEVEA